MRALSALGRARSYLRRSLVEPEVPLVVVEVRKGAIGVVRLERQGGRVVLASAASAALDPGLVGLTLTEPGLRDPDALGAALRGLLERAGALREGGAALVLPDPVGRFSVLPAQELQGKRGQELLDMVRFRLRRSVPFEVRDAQIAVAMPPRGGPDAAVAAALYRPVLQAFEALLARQGLSVGVVELSSLALLPLVESGGDSLLVNWDDGYVSLVLLRDGYPLLTRTLTEAAAEPASLVREAKNTLLYYQERLGGPGLATAFVRSAALPAEEAAAMLAEPLGREPSVLDPWAPFGGGEVAAGQALASALAVASRGVARRAA